MAGSLLPGGPWPLYAMVVAVAMGAAVAGRCESYCSSPCDELNGVVGTRMLHVSSSHGVPHQRTSCFV